MKRSLLPCGAVVLALSGATGFLVHACASPDLVETPSEKAEWSVLQRIEYQERERPLQKPSIRTVGDSEVLGVRGLYNQNIWILLKVQSPPFYKQMPEGNYELSPAFVAQLQKERRISYTVAQVLRSHIRENGPMR